MTGSALLMMPLAVCGVVAFACWLLSVVTREYSWVDRIWSIVPAVYAWLFAWEAGFTGRAVLLALLATAWGARLTFNFARKGGYAKGGEDYRWAALRKRMPPWAFQVFNVLFIAGYQNALIFLFTLPAWAVAVRSDVPLGGADVVLAVIFLALLVGETVADEQQWRFQQAKHAALARGESVEHRFLTKGLWRFSRHPNFFCETAQWWVYAAFVVVTGAPLLWLAVIGAPLLTLLFHGSANFTESLTLGKYPDYAGYQKSTSRMIPWFAPRA
jgi:steroid 5-alpha reductase family enzyme